AVRERITSARERRAVEQRELGVFELDIAKQLPVRIVTRVCQEIRDKSRLALLCGTRGCVMIQDQDIVRVNLPKSRKVRFALAIELGLLLVRLEERAHELVAQRDSFQIERDALSLGAVRVQRLKCLVGYKQLVILSLLSLNLGRSLKGRHIVRI